MNNLQLSETLKALRHEAGYTQAQVSDMLNIQRQTYCNYENALRTPPIETISALADIYGISVDSLITGREKKQTFSLEPVEQKLLSEFSSLEASLQKEVLAFIQFKKKYRPG